MAQLQNIGFKTVAMALRNDSVEIDDPELKRQEKLAIILGTEGEGLLAETMEACDYTVKIPMSHRCGFSECGSGECGGVLGAWKMKLGSKI